MTLDQRGRRAAEELAAQPVDVPHWPDVEARSRRRHRHVVAATSLVVAVVVLVVASPFVLRSDRRSTEVRSTPGTTRTAPTATTGALDASREHEEAVRALEEANAALEKQFRAEQERIADLVRVINADPARALGPDIPRCRVEDLSFVGERLVHESVLLRFAPRLGPDCALLSYPELFGRDQSGGWVPVVTEYQALDPVSSYGWTGLFSESVPGDPELLLRLGPVSPSGVTGRACPPGGPEAVPFSALRIELRDGGGSLELDVPVDVSGCGVAMSRFGYDTAGFG